MKKIKKYVFCASSIAGAPRSGRGGPCVGAGGGADGRVPEGAQALAEEGGVPVARPVAVQGGWNSIATTLDPVNETRH